MGLLHDGVHPVGVQREVGQVALVAVPADPGVGGDLVREPAQGIEPGPGSDEAAVPGRHPVDQGPSGFGLVPSGGVADVGGAPGRKDGANGGRRLAHHLAPGGETSLYEFVGPPESGDGGRGVTGQDPLLRNETGMDGPVRPLDVEQRTARRPGIDAPVASAPEEGNLALLEDLGHLRVETGTVTGVDDAALDAQTAAEPPLAFGELADVGFPLIEVRIAGSERGADVQPALPDEALDAILQLRTLVQQVLESVEELHVVGVVVILGDQADGVAQ